MAKLTPLILCNIQKFFLQASVLLDKSNFFQKTLDKFLFSGIIIPVRATRANEYSGFV